MRSGVSRRLRAATVLVAFVGLVSIGGPVSAGSSFDGRWLLTVTVPESPGSPNNRTFTISLNVNPRGESLVGRMTITDSDNRTVGGVWRQVGKRVSIAYELPCPDSSGSPCASLVMLGKIKFENTRLKKGRVIVMWDTANERDPSFYGTSVGTVSGERLP